jgi:hypothetical protein
MFYITFDCYLNTARARTLSVLPGLALGLGRAEVRGPGPGPGRGGGSSGCLVDVSAEYVFQDANKLTRLGFKILLI